MDALYMTLSRHFGTLTHLWVVSLSGVKLIPTTLALPFYGADRFGV